MFKSERNHQVAIMGHMTSLVVTWLGAGPRTLENAVRELHQTDWNLWMRSAPTFKETKQAVTIHCEAEYLRGMWTVQEL